MDLEAGYESTPLLAGSRPAYYSASEMANPNRGSSAPPTTSATNAVPDRSPSSSRSRDGSDSNDEAVRRAVNAAENGPTTARAKGRASNKGRTEARPNGWQFWKPSHTLVNKGSVARDHLALERTYLAWLRTSLTLSSIGIAITQLFRLALTGPRTTSSSAPLEIPDAGDVQNVDALQALLTDYAQRIDALEHPTSKYRYLAKPLGGTFIMLSLVILLLGTRRFFHVQNVMMEEPSRFPPSRRSVYFASLSLSILIIASFVVILVTK